MINNIVPVSLMRGLIVTYVILFAGLFFLRYYEINRTQKNSRIHYETGLAAMNRQLIITRLSKNNSFIRANMLTALYTQAAENRVTALLNIEQAVEEISVNIRSYRPYIIDKEESEKLTTILHLERLMIQNRRTITTQIQNNELANARYLSSENLKPVYDELLEAIHNLARYTEQRDYVSKGVAQGKLAKSSNLIDRLNFILLALMSVLGIFIMIIFIIILRRKTLLQKNDEKYRILIEQAHDITFRIDTDGIIRYANHKMSDLLEYTNQELTGISLSVILDPSVSRHLENKLSRILMNENLTHSSCIFISKNGRRIHLEGVHIKAFKGQRVDGITFFYRDVSSDRYLQEKLEASEKNFRHLFNMAPIPMYIFDPVSYRFLQVNDTAARYFQNDKEELLERTVVDYIPTHYRNFAENIREALKKDQYFSDNLSFSTEKGDQVDIEVYGSHFILESKRVIMVAIVDVTARNQQENRITKAIIKTQEEERYEIGSELHDNVCQILASAKMSMGLFKNSDEKSSRFFFKKVLNDINLATEEIRNLSHRLAPVFFQNTSLEIAIKQLILSFNVEEHHRVRLFFDSNLERYDLNRELQLNLYRILQEQLRNILKYASASNIEIEVVAHKGYLLLRIADDGIGFDKSVHSTGIGMANMRRRAEFFGGHMEVNTAQGQGCEIVITIPGLQESDS